MSKAPEDGLIVIHPALVLVMSRALNEALKAGAQGHQPRGSHSWEAGLSQEPKVIGWRGALEGSGCGESFRVAGSRVGGGHQGRVGWDHSSSDIS